MPLAQAAGLVGWGAKVLAGRERQVAEEVTAFGASMLGTAKERLPAMWTVLSRGGFSRGGKLLLRELEGLATEIWALPGPVMPEKVWTMLGGMVSAPLPESRWVGGARKEAVLAGLPPMRGLGLAQFPFPG